MAVERGIAASGRGKLAHDAENIQASAGSRHAAGEDLLEKNDMITRVEMNARRSRAVVSNGVVYLAGQVADNWDGDISSQTEETLRNIDKMLAKAGTDKTKLLSATIWIKNRSDYDAMNRIWDAWVSPGNTPGRACAIVEMADPKILVEIIPIAAL